jgi:two-component system, NtrC family, response regulator
MQKVLIIDDEEKLRSLLARILQGEGFDVLQAENCKKGLRIAENEDIDAILCDVKLPDGNGVELIPKLKLANPTAEIILLTAYGKISDGVLAIKNGAFDYIVKGDDNEKIIPLLHRAIEKATLQKRIAQLEKRVGDQFSFDSIIGTSKPIQASIDLAKKVSPTDASVLLTGETGTGKEVFAQAIHQASIRNNNIFMALNCSSFSKELLESELFGHVQGAFTGALKDKKGLVEMANNGTLFLDEIGEMPLELQAKLLRVLETNEFIKLGDTKTLKSNFRLIAATNKDLKTESEEHRFRSDLYFRLNVFQINLSPLKQRAKDIPALANHFLDLFCKKTNKAKMKMDEDFLEKLENYNWPGNIRELKNVIERGVILAENYTLTTELLPFEIQFSTSDSTKNSNNFSLAIIEKNHIQKMLAYTKGNKMEAARLLEIGTATLYRKLEEYAII